MRLFALLFSFLFLSVGNIFCNVPSWQKLTGCTLVSGAWRDGDSFHIKNRGKEYIFRLYFVDTPEDETRFPERIKDQAGYFGVSLKRAVEIGKIAADFTFKALSEKPFTVWTCWEDAMGSSRLPRFYAFIDVGDTPLASLLVANGLARIYGKDINLPDGADSGSYVAKLETLESQAKAQKKGGWGQNTSAGDITTLEPENGDVAEPVGSGSDIPAF